MMVVLTRSVRSVAVDAKLQSKLFKKYPKIFVQRKHPMTQTCMCWGIECGNGWYWLINMLCGSLQWDIDHKGSPQIEATQVKEKYGTLRFYTNTCNDVQDSMIHQCELLSEYLCEHCGSNDRVRQTRGWIVTLCHKCMKEYRAKNRAK